MMNEEKIETAEAIRIRTAEVIRIKTTNELIIEGGYFWRVAIPFLMAEVPIGSLITKSSIAAIVYYFKLSASVAIVATVGIIVGLVLMSLFISYLSAKIWYSQDKYNETSHYMFCYIPGTYIPPYCKRSDVDHYYSTRPTNIQVKILAISLFIIDHAALITVLILGLSNPIGWAVLGAMLLLTLVMYKCCLIVADIEHNYYLEDSEAIYKRGATMQSIADSNPGIDVHAMLDIYNKRVCP